MPSSLQFATLPRSAGVLLHVTSLPGPHGIGDFGPAATAWIDLLARAKQSWWQILPLVPPAAGASPYSGLAAMAGNPLLISVERLVRDKLLRPSDVPREAFADDAVDLARVEAFKRPLLERAWERFGGGAGGPALAARFARFRSANRRWLDDFALFVAIGRREGTAEWGRWPRGLSRREPAALRAARRELADVVAREQFVQFLFAEQWAAVRAHAAEKGVRVIGDLPIFVSHDSSDVWANRELFQLDAAGRPKAVAGVPPDYFSPDGQRWGNPLYDWPANARQRYRWWIDRVSATLKQTDLIRLDHFRAFAGYWRVPASAPTARTGRWVKGPGEDVFAAMAKALGGLPFIAEDLGMITPDVHALRRKLNVPGMRVLQFGFGSTPRDPFLPHNYEIDTIAYPSTHDNDTTVGWWQGLKDEERKRVQTYLPDADDDPCGALIAAAWSSVARLAIVAAQDVLRLGSEARMNTPGTADGNWSWRMRLDDAARTRFAELGELTTRYARDPVHAKAGERKPRAKALRKKRP